MNIQSEKLNLIKENPLLFAESNIADGRRRAVLSRQVSVYYR